MGGNNGFTDFKRILGCPITAIRRRSAALFVAHGVDAARRVSLGRCIVTSTKFGLVQTAIRDAENRVLFSGYNPLQLQARRSVAVARCIVRRSPGRSTCRRSASSIPARCRRRNRSRSSSGSRLAVAARSSARSSARSVVNAVKSWFTQRVSRFLADHPRRLFIVVTLYLPQWHRRLAAAEAAMSELAHTTDAGAPGLAQVGMRFAAAGVDTTQSQSSSPRRRQRELRRLQCAQQPVAYLDDGELRTVIGPNGAGKTTILDVITGKTRPDAGTSVLRPDDRPHPTERATDRARWASGGSSRRRRCTPSTPCGRISCWR